MGSQATVSLQLLRIIDQAYNRKSWHGTNLRGSIRGLTPRQTEWRPSPHRHNIHELVVHAAYWKYAVANRLARGRRGAFALKGSNWFTRNGSARQWTEDVALLEAVHRELRAVVAALRDDELDRPLPKSAMTPFTLVSGVAAHDLYHAGQIQLLKTLQR
ncbi:MAG: DinB family protein [Vicinamibacterales bacterium]